MSTEGYTPSKPAIAEWLRDERMTYCEHFAFDVCSPCLRDRILASDWMAEHDRQTAEKAWDEGCRAAEQFYKRTVIGVPGSKAIEAPANPYRAKETDDE